VIIQGPIKENLLLYTGRRQYTVSQSERILNIGHIWQRQGLTVFVPVSLSCHKPHPISRTVIEET